MKIKFLKLFQHKFQKLFMNFLIFLFLILLNFNVYSTLAQSEIVTKPRQDFKEIGGLISNLTNNVVLNLTIFFGAAAFTAFMYGLFMYILDRVNDKTGGEGEKKAKEFMLWSIVALFVMVSVWGIVRMFQSFVGVDPKKLNQELPVICISGVNCEGDDYKSETVLDNSPLDINELRNPSPQPESLSKKKLGESCTVLAGGNKNTECDDSKGYYCKADKKEEQDKPGSNGVCAVKLDASLLKIITKDPGSLLEIGKGLDVKGTLLDLGKGLFKK